MSFKERAWYSVYHDEIVVEESPRRIVRGCQALMRVSGTDLKVRDYFALYDWKIEKKLWLENIQDEMLIELGEV